MITVYPPAGVLGVGRYRTTHRTVRPLSIERAMALVDDLDRRGISVAANVTGGGVLVQLIAKQALSTADEVRVLAAFRSVTDARLNWCGTEA